MKTFKNSDFNAISEEKKKSLKKLAPGQTATFEWIQFEKDHLTGRPIYGGARTLPGRDRIKDGDNVVEIGVVEKSSATLDGVKIRCKKKLFTGGGPNGTVAARFTLSGDDVEDVEWYEFLQMANFNESNPNAAKTVVKLIKEIDFKAEAGKTRATRAMLTKVLNAVDTMTNQSILVMAASLNMDVTVEPEVIREQLGVWAQANPKAFLDRAEDKVTTLQAEVKMAETHGFLLYDQEKHLVKDRNGVHLATLAREEGKTWVEIFADAINTNTTVNGAWKPVRKLVTDYLKAQQEPK